MVWCVLIFTLILPVQFKFHYNAQLKNCVWYVTTKLACRNDFFKPKKLMWLSLNMKPPEILFLLLQIIFNNLSTLQLVCDYSSVSRQYFNRSQYIFLSWCEHFLNPLNPELNPICYLLALLGAHHFLHVSRIRVKLLTFRLLMSYIYIWSTHSWCF